MDHIEKLANLLATENLTVNRGAVKTAQFDVKDRVLTIPQWKDMSDQLETMLVGHEIGHALYTSLEMLQNIDGNKTLHSYVNVVEDARIERFVKKLYPGLRKYFISGYKELQQRDIFGIKEKDVNELNLIDRINIYFKLGILSGIKFSKQELPFISKVERADTEEQVIAVAKELYELAKETDQKQKQTLAQNSDTDEDDGDEEYGDFDAQPNYSDDSDESENESEESSEDENSNEEESYNKSFNKDAGDPDSDADLEPITQKNLQKNIEEMADSSYEHATYQIETNLDPEIVVGYKQILKETAVIDTFAYTDYELRNSFDKFISDSEKAVSYLVKQFEMKKSADLYKRSTVAKSGSLDMKKIYGYKLNEDLFRRVSRVKEGKNHGMLFMLDWSGSMMGNIHDTVKQLIPLAMFCRRTQIPFKVFAFSNGYRTDEYENKYHPITQHIEKDESYFEKIKSRKVPFLKSFRLLEFMTDKMSNVEFMDMCRRMYRTTKLSSLYNYKLFGTPLNQSLQYMLEYIPYFKRVSNVQKLTLITLTDGDSQCIFDQLPRWSTEDSKREIKNFVYDPQTNTKYEVSKSFVNRSSSRETNILLNMIKNRYGVNSIGFYLCKPTTRNLTDALYSNSLKYDAWYGTEIETAILQAKKDIRANGVYSMKGLSRDKLFVVPQDKLQIQQETLEVDRNMTPARLAKQFNKFLSKNKHSRVLLDEFVNVIA